MFRWFTLLFFFSIQSSLAYEFLRIGTMDLPPYGWTDSGGVKKGIIYDLNEEIGKRYGVPYTNSILPFKRMLNMLQKGEIDLISSQAHESSLAAGDKVAIQFEINVIAATRKDSKIRSFKDLKGKNFVYHRGASYKQLEGYPNSIHYVGSYEQSLLNLVSNRNSHAAIFSEPAYYFWMKEQGLKTTDFGEVIMIEAGKKQWILVRKNLPEYKRRKIKEIVDQIYQEHLYEDLLRKYGKGGV